jgi:hypothetical protein
MTPTIFLIRMTAPENTLLVQRLEIDEGPEPLQQMAKTKMMRSISSSLFQRMSRLWVKLRAVHA